MAWKIEAWFGYEGWLDKKASQKTDTSEFLGPGVKEIFDVKQDAISRGEELLVDGFSATVDGVYHHFPASSVVHLKLSEVSGEE